MTPEPGELGLLQGLAENQPQAVASIYRDHYPMIHHLVTQNNGSADDARDIFQEAMIVLYEKAKSPAFTLRCQLKTYLYAVARRLWLKQLQRQQKYVPEIRAQEEPVSVEEDLTHHEEKNAEFLMMEKALQGLGEPCKSLLEAFYLHQKNMTDIARTFGYTNADNAKNQKYKCLMRLKKLFFTEYPNRQSE